MPERETPDNKTPRKAASRRRGRRPAAAEERKDRVIQARVPEDLETTLKEAAEKRRMSVSHLIRNVLEDTFTLVDNIVADSSALVEQVSRDAGWVRVGGGEHLRQVVADQAVRPRSRGHRRHGQAILAAHDHANRR